LIRDRQGSLLGLEINCEVYLNAGCSMLDARKMESSLKDGGIRCQPSRAQAGAHLVTSTTIFNQREMRF